MGLGAPRKRSKISHDPNNTTWSRSTTNYGHKLLLSQGWTPGSYLGAVNASHAHLHSDASASHIRVAIKDDNLGLGAKRGSGQGAGECTGLDVFQGLLGRLNGKSEAVLEKEQKSRDDLKQALYTERRFGALRFVSGGVLVGDRIEKLVEDEKLRIAGKLTSSLDQGSLAPPHDETKMSVKGLTEASRDHSTSTESSNTTQTAASELDALEIETEDQEAATALDQENSGPEKSSDKAKRKAEKAQRRLKRRERKEGRRAARAERHPAAISSCTTSPSDQQSELHNQPRSDESQPSSVVAVTAAVSGRHAVRQRYIRQKKLAVMDPKALNEIFMVKG
ncbi:telomerase inhibitor [Trapelia coarctata]|nr:telomerase inhibitor [Trapelia coarctata]